MKKILLLSIVCLVTLSCTVGPDYERPIMNIPDHYKEDPSLMGTWKLTTPQDCVNQGEWWKIFNDFKLNTLIKDLHERNHTIAIAWANYRQAIALAGEASAAFGPTANLGGAITPTQPNPSYNATKKSLTKNKPVAITTSQLSASWVMDLWGQISRQVESAEAQVDSALASWGGANLSLETELASLYYQIRILDALQEAENSLSDAYKRLYENTQRQMKHGVVNDIDVLQAKTFWEMAKISAKENELARDKLEHALGALVGQAPAQFTLDKVTWSDKSPPTVSPELPSSLLERRPDIAQAERLVAAANANIGVAVAGFFPLVTLNASGGFYSALADKLFTLPARVWSVGPQMILNVFDGGLQRFKVVAAEASYDQAVANYRGTVMDAFQQVEDDLVNVTDLTKEVSWSHNALSNAQRIVKLTKVKVSAGTITPYDLITAEIILWQNKITYLNLRLRQYTSTISLITSLGGSWNKEAEKIITP